jgi:hypothetical protein
MKEPKDSQPESSNPKQDSASEHPISTSPTQSNLAEEKTKARNQTTETEKPEHDRAKVSMGWLSKSWDFVRDPRHSNAHRHIFVLASH